MLTAIRPRLLLHSQLRLLRAANFQLESDLRDKFDAFGIDTDCAELKSSGDVDFHRESVRVDSKAVMPADWRSFSEENIRRAQDAIAASVGLREAIDSVLKDTSDALNQAANAVESAFNSRIAEYNDARQVAQQQLLKVRREIAAQDQTIAAMEDAISSQNDPLKVSQTRLLKRSDRPNVELVRDDVQASLLTEVDANDGVVASLAGTLAEAKTALKALVRSELQLEEDVATKTASLNIDKRCMQHRQQFKYRVTAE